MDVEIAGLRFERHGRRVLDIPSLRLVSGRTTAILGPNGAGKTTLLRLIAGLERAQQGRIVIGGRPVEAGAKGRPDVAFVFQEQVFLRQSVRHNLELGLRLRGIAREERRARIDDTARLLGTTELLDRGAHQLSVGEGRRVSIVRALCLRAPLVLLDEPLAGLDVATYGRLLDELPGLLKGLGTTALLVTHSRQEALRLGSDLVILVDGRVEASGHKREVALQPGGVEVAGVLGYSVVVADGRRIAVPPGAFAVGPGRLQFQMLVDDVVDLGDHLEVVGRIGEARIRVATAGGLAMPAAGSRLLVHAQRAFELPSNAANG